MDKNAHFSGAPARRAAALARLEAEVGRTFASWDAVTEVPHRLMLEGMPAPGVMGSAAEAERVATAFVARHLDVLAPGSALDDFVLVTNDLSAGIRSVGFVQQYRGVPVLGGQVSLRFKHDRLVMIGSEALPDVAIAGRSVTATDATLRRATEGWLGRGVAGTLTATGPIEGPFVLPLIDASTGTLTYAEVFRTSASMQAPASAWTLYLDAATGAPVARQQTLLFGTGQLLFDVPLRNPTGPRLIAPADQAFVEAAGNAVTTTDFGFFNFPGANGIVAATVDGVFASVTNEAGDEATTELPIADGGTAVWQDGSEVVEAQLAAYVHTMRVKDFVRTLSDVDWLDDPIPVNVNIDDSCNAFSDGNSINFFLRGGGCENTALISDVVYHEFGHSIHSQSVLPGVGQFNVSLSEGISDYLSATLTEDSGLARGFFLGSDEPLRDFDPVGSEFRWPEDRGEVHDEGRIIGGALWDLRKIMQAKLGEGPGRQYTDRVWYETTRRAVDIPSMYPEALLLDDDDGNLANGTPNACEINAAYGPHGLFNVGPENEVVDLLQTADGPRVELSLSIPNFPDCPITASPTIRWRERGSTDESDAVMAIAGDGVFTALLPELPAGSVLEYQIDVNYDNGAQRALPDNIVDPWYQAFYGEVVELGCLDATVGRTTDNTFVVGAWLGGESGSDPNAPFDDLSDHIYQPGNYPPFTTDEITFDAIDTGAFTNVRLQMQRWLAVEDGFYDQAFIRVNDEQLWTNFAANDDSNASFHHVDREWRFVDFDLSDFIGPDGISVTFGTRSDGGLEFGGWTVANACIVALANEVATCGDGIVDAPIETCDDGNVDDGDGCSADCQSEPAPPIPEEPQTTGEDTDDDAGDVGTGGDTDGDEPSLDGDGLIDRGCGCTSDEAPGAAWLLLLSLPAIRRRRRGARSGDAARRG